jgi:glycosyltransferase involved in cell wall biosynthesis
MKIAIESKGLDGWGGGIDFLRHLASCIEITDVENQFDKHIILSKNDWFLFLKRQLFPLYFVFRQLREGQSPHWVSWKGFDEVYLRQTFSDFKSYKLDFAGSLLSSHQAFAESEKMDVLLPCISPPPEGFSLPWIGYIYDFQHKYHPEFFSMHEIQRRDYQFINMLSCAKHLIVNATAVKVDAEKFVGNFKAKIHVLPFSPSPREKWLQDDRDLTKNYSICKPYFIICNQFWIHKDHSTAIRAFAEFLENEGRNYQLVCTGETSDHRFPNYFNSLKSLINDLKLTEDVKIVGHIPKLDQISLLKGSVAVIQPTLFEGGPGGGAAYDAIALGKPLIVSDIPVNLEIEKSERVFFFKTRSKSDLASILKTVSQTNFKLLTNKTLRAMGLKRKEICGRFLLDVIHEAVDHQK